MLGKYDFAISKNIFENSKIILANCRSESYNKNVDKINYHVGKFGIQTKEVTRYVI
jgi:hypothetical protein